VDLRGRRGVVAGAGSGIGRELALAFGRRGGHLLLVGRREQPLRETAELVREAGGTDDVLAVDITAPGKTSPGRSLPTQATGW
jgi:short-subunit dehydrogenase